MLERGTWKPKFLYDDDSDLKGVKLKRQGVKPQPLLTRCGAGGGENQVFHLLPHDSKMNLVEGFERVTEIQGRFAAGAPGMAARPAARPARSRGPGRPTGLELLDSTIAQKVCSPPARPAGPICAQMHHSLRCEAISAPLC
eukprot:6190035-Pleurochrysis_carterae.AAC.2